MTWSIASLADTVGGVGRNDHAGRPSVQIVLFIGIKKINEKKLPEFKTFFLIMQLSQVKHQVIIQSDHDLDT